MNGKTGCKKPVSKLITLTEIMRFTVNKERTDAMRGVVELN